MNTLYSYSQSQEKEILKFDRRFVHCINKWVAFGYDKKDNSFEYGFVYPNSSQEISLSYVGTIKLDSNGHFVTNNKIDSLGVSVIYRLSPEQNRKIVGIIPIERLKEIGVEEYPKEFKSYISKDGKNIQHLRKLIHVFLLKIKHVFRLINILI